MVYIVTQKYDPTSDSIIDWLIFHQVPYKRVNNYVSESHKFHCTIHLDKNKNKSEDILWIRKPSYSGQLNHIHNEINKGLFEIADWKFKKVIGNFNRIYCLNKLKILTFAQNLNILIPPTMVTTDKSELLEFISQHGEIITKCCSDMSALVIDGVRYYQYTSLISDEIISKLPDSFCVSLFQKHIKKYAILKFFIWMEKFGDMLSFLNHRVKHLLISENIIIQIQTVYHHLNYL